jgi:hypothetical protein
MTHSPPNSDPASIQRGMLILQGVSLGFFGVRRSKSVSKKNQKAIAAMESDVEAALGALRYFLADRGVAC